jgi:hypothetical protein
MTTKTSAKPAAKKSAKTATIDRRALRLQQSPDCLLYIFTLTAAQILQIADISRVSRDQSGDLIGYQRPEVRQHIQEITDSFLTRSSLPYRRP